MNDVELMFQTRQWLDKPSSFNQWWQSKCGPIKSSASSNRESLRHDSFLSHSMQWDNDTALLKISNSEAKAEFLNCVVLTAQKSTILECHVWVVVSTNCRNDWSSHRTGRPMCKQQKIVSTNHSWVRCIQLVVWRKVNSVMLLDFVFICKYTACELMVPIPAFKELSVVVSTHTVKFKMLVQRT